MLIDMFCNRLYPHAHPPSRMTPLVGSQRLLIQYIRSWRPSLSPYATLERAILWWQGNHLTNTGSRFLFPKIVLPKHKACVCFIAEHIGTIIVAIHSSVHSVSALYYVYFIGHFLKLYDPTQYAYINLAWSSLHYSLWWHFFQDLHTGNEGDNSFTDITPIRLIHMATFEKREISSVKC
jgi:hypothetical protein